MEVIGAREDVTPFFAYKIGIFFACLTWMSEAKIKIKMVRYPFSNSELQFFLLLTTGASRDPGEDGREQGAPPGVVLASYASDH